MSNEKKIIELGNRIRALSQNGLVYSTNEYDIERYNELLEISHELLAAASDSSVEQIKSCLHTENDYVTPKVDIRAVVFNEKEEILLVQERADGKWSLPGGWADVGYSPREIAVKEVGEETGLDVTPVRLLAVYDKKYHEHPPALHYAYKICILCEITGGKLQKAFDILDCGFFPIDQLPPLSLERILESQIKELYSLYKEKSGKVALD